jgi:RNA polymerase subunit RPABC4/transcription elongation factor Spt4
MTVPFLLDWPGGSLESTIRLVVLLLVTYALVLWLSAIVWVYRDVRTRISDDTSQWVAVLLVALFNVPGLIVYLVVRPQSTLADAYERSLETEAILRELHMTANSCQSCHRPVEDDFQVCPYCRTVLREACRSCGRAVRTSWTACPYCAMDRAPSRVITAQAQSQSAADEVSLPPRPRAAAPAQAEPAPTTVRRPPITR